MPVRTTLPPATVEASRGPTGIVYFQIKAFSKALKEANLKGGQPQKNHDRVRVVLGSLGDSDDPFASLSVTNHGERRIRDCVKYDIGDGWRLVTQQNDKACTFLFVGNHDDTDKWLEGHKGEDIGVRDNRLVRIPGVGTGPVPQRQWMADQHEGALVDLLEEDEVEHLLEGLSARLIRDLTKLDGGSGAEELEQLVALIPDGGNADFVRTVLTLLMAGNVDGGKAHIGVRSGKVAPLVDVDTGEMIDVEDGEDVRRLRVGSPEYGEWLRSFQKLSPWQDWFLFLHPQQEKVVEAEYPGVAQLSGVSGSGKTCVVVRRAIRLAREGSAKVLLLTLNRSLAGLLHQLVDAACTDELVRARIEVMSFFDLARRFLIAFEPANTRHYEDVTWKLGEHVDEVFREYYRQWLNSREASVLLPLHKIFNARGVSGEVYTREEFDWIRSAVAPEARAEYLPLDRKGRKLPIPRERRQDLLRGLEGWERKMGAVGIVDYLGLTNALARHLDEVRPAYTNVLVDEAQDFGTTELRVVRKLVRPGANDIFLCGDIAQTVLPKHRSLEAAGFSKPVRERIQQNYRNSREILAAAYDLLKNNLHEEMFDSEDLEILDPRFANFSGPVPMALAAGTLEEEIAYARSYAATCLGQDARTVCVAFAGFSSRDVSRFAKRCRVTALDGNYDPGTDALVFSDLEQTKGYEFDCLVIVNCRDGVLPAREAPVEEAFRETCRLYVAMTRAKKELILSFHDAASPWIVAVSGTISSDHWASCEILDEALRQGVPEVLSEIETKVEGNAIGHLTGSQFLYTMAAVGMSNEAQEKLVEVVDGMGMTAAGSARRIRWANMGALAADLRASKRQDALLGPKIAEEVRAAIHVP